jgi:hypothetical protein
MRVWEKSTPPPFWSEVWEPDLARPDALESTTKVVPREVEQRAVPTMKASSGV